MKLGLMKRVLATGLCVAMLLGDTLPALATDSVSGGDAVEAVQETASAISENAAVSGNDIVEIEEEELPLGDTLEDIVLVKEVSGVTITLTAPAGALPEGAELWAKEIVRAAELATIDEALEAEEEKEEIEVQQYKAFDIKILVDGEEVQPEDGVTVTFAGDILLPQNENEDVTVYHVSEDAVANEMEAVVTDDAVEMATDHFSIYVIVVKDVIETRTVTFKHYLGAPGNATMIYAPSTLTVEKNHEITSQQLPVQGVGSYNMDTVIVKSNGEEDVTYTNNFSDAEVIIELTGIENVIEMYYSEATHQDIPFMTTFFDYYVDDVNTTYGNAYESVTINQWDILYNFKIGDKNYPSTRGRYTVERLGNNGLLKNYQTGDLIYLTDGMVIENVTRQTDEYRDTKQWDEVIYLDGGFYRTVSTRGKASENAGINGVNHTEGRPFLAMGLSNESVYNFYGNPDGVSSYADFGVKNMNGNPVNFNANNSDSSGVDYGEYAIASGLVTGLSGDDYEDLVMGYASPIVGHHDGGKHVVDSIDTSVSYQIQEPGYFTKTTSDYKALLENYELRFDITGNTYSLDYALNTQNNNKTYSWIGGIPWEGGQVNNKFLPLNDAEKLAGRQYYQPYAGMNQWYDNSNNYYFGMRYDFTFSLGSYIGPMNYQFYGDDDLWVFVDGELVLDLGGMHSAYPGKYKVTNEPNEVDLWKALFDIDTTQENWWEVLADEQKTHEYQVTVLYMERGGYESTCAMKFVVPNVATKEPVVAKTQLAELKIKKIEKDSDIALENVTFTLTDDDGAVVEASTDVSGNLSFGRLSGGIYTLTETTPDGYYGAGPWNVVVIGETNAAGDEIVYSVESVTDKKTGEALANNNGIYTIENEKIPPAVDQSKTVEVVNWDERTYKITLEASSLVQKIEEVEGSVDIVFALDISSSMDEKVGSGKNAKTRLAILKESVNSFIDKVADISPESKISIVTYGNMSASVEKGLTTLDANGVKTLKSAVNGLSTNGGTPQHLGFKKANEVISASTNDNKYVIFVGDGRPEFYTSNIKSGLSAADDLNLLTASEQRAFKNLGDGNWDAKQPYLQKMVKHFANLTKQNATVMTLGIALDSNTKQLMKEYATSDSFAYTTDNVSDMGTILEGIGDTIMSSLPVTGASVVDYIDSRFDLISADGTKLAVGAIVTDANGNKGTVCEDSKGIYVKWEDTTIQVANRNGAGWSAEIYVKAKDEFIGGNFIPTNGDNSGITADDEFFPFDKPTTNVKLLAIDIEDKEIDLFKGEDIVPADYVAELNDTLSVISIEEEPVALCGALKLTEEQVEDLMDGETLAVPYSYEGDEIGSFVYTLESDYEWQTHVAEEVGENVESYELHVYFQALSEEDRAEEMGEGYDAPVAGTPEVDITTPTEIGYYTVNVIAGALTIKKTIDLSQVNFQQGDPIFTFKVMKDGEFYSYHTVRYTEASKEGNVVVATLTGLAKGVYTVEELDTLRYELSGITIDGSADRSADVAKKAATFGIGRDIATTDTVLDNLDGAASFTNTRTNNRNYSDTDVVVNTFVIGEDGTINWTADTLAQ